MPPTTSTPSSSASTMSFSPSGKEWIPCWGNATSWMSITPRPSSRTRSSARTAVNDGSQTSTWARRWATPCARSQRSAVSARREMSSVVRLVTRSAQISMPSKREPLRFDRGSPSVRTASRWRCGSTRAAVTSRPSASISTAPRSVSPRPMRTMCSPRTPMSTGRSTPAMRACRTTRSTVSDPPPGLLERLGELPHLVSVGRRLGGLLDHAELERDVRGALEGLGVHLPGGRLGRRGTPDELVDLRHHPGLGGPSGHRALLQDQVHPRGRLVPAELPALERRPQEPRCRLLVRAGAEPVRAGEDPVLQHGRAFRVEVDDDQVLRLDAAIEHLLVLVVGHGRRRVDLLLQQEVHVERLLDERE